MRWASRASVSMWRCLQHRQRRLRGAVRGLMAPRHRLRCAQHLGRALGQLRARAAVALVGVAGQLDAVDGEHLPADLPLLVADQQHALEDLGNGLCQARDEAGDGREVWGVGAHNAMKVT